MDKIIEKTIQLGISPCPNDTFTFHGLISGAVDLRGLRIETQYLDVEELNERTARGEFDIAKVSFHAALSLGEEVVVLPTGSALGFGVGPVVLAHDTAAAKNPNPRVLTPGKWTTAHLLWRLFHPNQTDVHQVIFSEIVPALERAEADLGVCIHEGRFTYAERGLILVEDLGKTWEDEVREALPLGGIVGRRKLGLDTLRTFQAVLADSLSYGLAHREECLPTMQAHAQEQEADVLWKHVELYVNEWTQDLGERGRSALEALAWRARSAGVVSPVSKPLEILS
ncbi:MAG: 1,4-dihydroxy-6-naphthoate synthase [Planctomycetota bacterium]